MLQAVDDFLSLEPPPKKRGRPAGSKGKPRVEPAAKITREDQRGKSMVRSQFGKDRIWACDGEYVWFRPHKYEGGQKVLRANPASYERHQRFLAAGHYTHIETQDDVEVYRVNPESPFARKGLYVGEMSDTDLRRQVAIQAVKRDWVGYVDCLEELFGRIKNRGYDASFAAAIKEDYLKYIALLIQMRGGPTPAECSAGLANVMNRRGTGTGRVILLPGGK